MPGEFSTTLANSFDGIDPSQPIPTRQFAEACGSILPIFTHLGTVFHFASQDTVAKVSFCGYRRSLCFPPLPGRGWDPGDREILPPHMRTSTLFSSPNITPCTARRLASVQRAAEDPYRVSAGRSEGTSRLVESMMHICTCMFIHYVHVCSSSFSIHINHTCKHTQAGTVKVRGSHARNLDRLKNMVAFIRVLLTRLMSDANVSLKEAASGAYEQVN